MNSIDLDVAQKLGSSSREESAEPEQTRKIPKRSAGAHGGSNLLVLHMTCFALAVFVTGSL
jgi:hypothetical protein